MASGVIRNFSKTLPNLTAVNGVTIGGQKGTREGDIVSYIIEFHTTKTFATKEKMLLGFNHYTPPYAGMCACIAVSWHTAQLFHFCLWYDENNILCLVPLEAIPSDVSLRLALTYAAS